jgi:thiol-disulfide isomerase/thioredoxin
MTEENKSLKEQKNTPSLMTTLVIVGFLSLVLGWGASKFVETLQNNQKISIQNRTWAEFLNTTWKNSEGNRVNTSAWKGKTLVVNFWGSWCPPCVEEMPMLAKVSEELKPQNVLFVGIGIDSPTNIRDFLNKTPVPYQIIVGGLDGSNWSKQLGNETGGLPFTAIINPMGDITFKKLGKIEENELKKAIISGK